MKRFINFIRTTAIGGLLVIVPIAIILFVLAQLIYGLYSVAEATMTELNIAINDAVILFLIATGALVGLCFLTGLIVRTRIGIVFKRWFGRNIAKRIPMYGALASLTRRFAGVEGHQFSAVEIDLYGTDTRVLGFRIENLPNGRCAVFVPSAPIATAGGVFIVPVGAVTPLSASVADTLTAITQWGVDTQLLYKAGPGDKSLVAQELVADPDDST